MLKPFEMILAFFNKANKELHALKLFSHNHGAFFHFKQPLNYTSSHAKAGPIHSQCRCPNWGIPILSSHTLLSLLVCLVYLSLFRHPARLLPKAYWLSYLNKWPPSSVYSNWNLLRNPISHRGTLDIHVITCHKPHRHPSPCLANVYNPLTRLLHESSHVIVATILIIITSFSTLDCLKIHNWCTMMDSIPNFESLKHNWLYVLILRTYNQRETPLFSYHSAITWMTSILFTVQFMWMLFGLTWYFSNSGAGGHGGLFNPNPNDQMGARWRRGWPPPLC